MTDRRPTDDDLLLEALEAAQTGNGASAAAEARLGHDRALQAELEGLKAVQNLLKQDAAWGQSSGADAPPPQLLDAILRAEVLARPEAIRAAVVARADDAVVGGAAAPPSAGAGLWSKVSSWLLGGGVVVGAAAALMVTVSRAPADLAAPKAAAARTAAEAPAVQTVAPAMPTAAAPVEVPAPETADPATTAPTGQPGSALALQEGSGRAGTDVDRKVATRLEKANDSLAPAAPLDQGEARRDGFADGSVGGSIGDVSTGDVSTGALAGGGAGLKADAAGPKGDAAPLKDKATKERALEFDADDEAEAPAQQPSPPPPAEPMPAAAPPTSAAPLTPSPSKPAPRIVSAAEAQQNFLRARAKSEALEEAKSKAMSQAESKAKAKAPAAKKASRDALEDAGAAREQLARSQRLQEANGVLVTAERELQFGRFAVALDLAQQAEGLAGGGLGLAPASTQTRAFAGLKRPADAARVASRLLQGSPADPQLVDGMLAGADAAVAIGDLRLAERLLVRASSMENPDVARRTEAKRRLQLVVGKKAAAPVRESAAPSTISSDSP